MIVCWGELLWDVHRAPGESPDPPADGSQETETLGGCACNVAFHAAQLGAKDVTLISRVGSDARGDRALSALRQVGVNTECISRDPHSATAAVSVQLIGGEPRYRMLSRMDWSQLRVSAQVARALSCCRAFVFGTLAQRSPHMQVLETANPNFEDPHTGAPNFELPGSHRAPPTPALAEALSLLPDDCLRVLDLNLRPSAVTARLVEACVSQADVVKLNRDETQALGNLLQTDDPIAWLFRHSRVGRVIQTLGAEGSVVHVDGRSLHCPGVPLESTDHADSIGAGDAFCARWVVGMLRGETPEALGEECNAFAARVASRRGATPRFEGLPGSKPGQSAPR